MDVEDSLRSILRVIPGLSLAVLFGSAARGEAGRRSDLDVGVLFAEGGKDPSGLEVALSRAAGRAVDLVRLDSAPPLLRFEIARDGRVLVEIAPHAWADFRARAMVDWWDWAPTARMLHAAAARGCVRGWPMVRPDVAGARVARARAWLEDAAALLGRTPEEFVADTRGRDLALFYLLLAIQECIDLAAHWVADEGWAPPDDAGSTFDVLADRGAIGREVADALRGAAGLRNRIAHGYAMLDYGRVHRESQSGLPALRVLLEAVARAAGL
jgi:uncharacterized protein YutE (UPF0331/DUF86 family)/predicted nucleotidyltransferase